MISSRRYLEALLVERDRRLDERFALQQRALDIASQGLSKRLEALNDLRGAVVSRGEYEEKHKALTERHDADMEAVWKELNQFQRWRSNVTGRAVALAFLGAILIAVVAGFITHLATS